MKKITFAVVALFVALGVSAQASVKFGYVDMQKALSMTKKGKSAMKELKKIQASKQKELKKKEATLKKEEAALKKEEGEIAKKFAVYSDEKKMQVQKNFQRKVMEFQRKAAEAQQYFGKSQRELVTQEKEKFEPIFKGLRETIDKYAKKEGFTMVFEKVGSSVLYAEKSTDITNEIVKKYGK